jgi:hypothetical protein
MKFFYGRQIITTQHPLSRTKKATYQKRKYLLTNQRHIYYQPPSQLQINQDARHKSQAGQPTRKENQQHKIAAITHAVCNYIVRKGHEHQSSKIQPTIEQKPTFGELLYSHENYQPLKIELNNQNKVRNIKIEQKPKIYTIQATSGKRKLQIATLESRLNLEHYHQKRQRRNPKVTPDDLISINSSISSLSEP